jgi:hypothetical protein
VYPVVEILTFDPITTGNNPELLTDNVGPTTGEQGCTKNFKLLGVLVGVGVGVLVIVGVVVLVGVSVGVLVTVGVVVLVGVLVGVFVGVLVTVGVTVGVGVIEKL